MAECPLDKAEGQSDAEYAAACAALADNADKADEEDGSLALPEDDHEEEDFEESDI